MVDRIGKQSLTNSLSFLVFVNKSKKLYLIKRNISKSMSFLMYLQAYKFTDLEFSKVALQCQIN